jgi:hypothetical protein
MKTSTSHRGTYYAGQQAPKLPGGALSIRPATGKVSREGAKKAKGKRTSRLRASPA